MTPKVSAIIPVYNVEEYLEQCLDSVLNQTLREVEIICINDGSTDSSLELLKKFALKDSRIKIIDKKNEGPSAARNEGIKTAAAPYILFFDADDYLEHNALEEAFKCAENSDVALVCFGTNIVGEVSPKQKASDERYYAVEQNGVVEFTDELRLNMNVAPSNKLFKTSVIKENNIEFIEEETLAILMEEYISTLFRLVTSDRDKETIINCMEMIGRVYEVGITNLMEKRK